jgi:hypothetical protein
MERRGVYRPILFSFHLRFREDSVLRAEFSLFSGNGEAKFSEKMNHGLPAYVPRWRDYGV